MKKLLFMTMVFALIVASTDAKEKTIKYGKNVIYQGNVENNEPFGEGILQVTGKNSTDATFLIKGKFQGPEVTAAEMSFPGGYSYKGKGNYMVSKKPVLLTINLKPGGELYDKDGKLIGIVTSEEFSIVITPEDQTHIAAEGILEERTPVTRIKEFCQYAKDDSYEIDYSVMPIDLPLTADPSNKVDFTPTLSLRIDDNGWDYSPAEYAANYTVTFSNGTVIRVCEDQEKWEKPSGERLVFEYTSMGQVVQDYRVNLDNNEYLETEKVRHQFENGNSYEGSTISDFLGFYTNYQGLLGLKKIDWEWPDFFSGVSTDGGIVVFSDGTRYEGSFRNVTEETELWESTLPEEFYNTGKLYNPDGMIVHTYVDGKNEIQLAEEKRKAEEEKERRRLAYEESVKTDFLKFDEKHPDFVKAFKKTFSDMSVIEAENRDGTRDAFEYLTITYPDGTIYKDYSVIRRSSYVKQIYSWTVAPSFYDVRMLPYYYWDETYYSGLGGEWVFPDGMVIKGRPSLITKDTPANYANVKYDVIIHTPNFENGDYAEFQIINNPPRDGIGEGRQYSIKSFMKSFPDCVVQAVFADQKIMAFPEEYEELWSGNLQPCIGTISYNNGSCFIGIFTVRFLSSLPEPAINKDPRIKALNARIVSTLDNMVLGKRYDGKDYDPDGKLIAIYRDGKQLDPFEVAKVLAQEQAERAKEEAKLKEEKERKAKYENDCKKYGKKYVDAWEFSHMILVGTPEEFFLDNVGKVELYYESNYTRSYHVRTLGGDIGLSIDVDKSTKKITHVYDHRH